MHLSGRPFLAVVAVLAGWLGGPAAQAQEFGATAPPPARGRRTVIAAMGHRLCKQHEGAAVVARATCHPLRGDDYYLGGFDLCTIPRL